MFGGELDFCGFIDDAHTMVAPRKDTTPKKPELVIEVIKAVTSSFEGVADWNVIVTL